MDEDILNGYVEGDGYTADSTGSVLKIDGWSTNGAVFFVAMEENGKYVYEVMEADDLDGIYDDDTYVQILTRTDAKSTTVVGGYLYVTETAPAEHGYLYVTKLLKTTADGRKVEAVFEDGTAKTIVIEDGRNDPLKNVLYEYTYNVIDDIYTLSNVPMRRQNNEIEDLDDYEVYTDDGDSMELDDEIIAIFTVEVNYDGAVSADGTPEFSLVNRGVQFVRLKELKLSMIENDVDNRTYTQYTDYRLDSGSLFYVVNYRIMESAEDAGVELHKYLLDLYECILDGDTIFTV